MVLTLANGGCQGDAVSAKGSADVLGEASPAFAVEPNGADGQESGVALGEVHIFRHTYTRMRRK